MKKSPIPSEISTEVKAIEAFLRRFFEENDTATIITYEDISSRLGRDVRERRWALSTARKRLEKMFNRSTLTVNGVGIRLCDSLDHVVKGEKKAKSIARQSRSALHESRRVVLEDLDEANRHRAITNQTLFGTLACVASADGVKRIESATKVNNSEIPPLKILKAFIE